MRVRGRLPFVLGAERSRAVQASYRVAARVGYVDGAGEVTLVRVRARVRVRVRVRVEAGVQLRDRPLPLT